jgi:hypothetical protein
MPSLTHSPAMSTTTFGSYGSYTPASSMLPILLSLSQLPLTTECALVHTALAYWPGTALPIVYDAALDPSSAAPYGIDEPTLRRYLGQSALSVPTECLVLEYPALGSTITVRAGAAVDARSPHIDHTVPLPLICPSMGAVTPRQLATITVSNVLNAIHHKLHESLPRQEFDPLDPTSRHAVHTAAQIRCTAGPEEREKGVKRIDLLTAAGMGTRVAGLSATKQSSQVWVLSFR